jgi:glycosyltransferase involved in cell wall biosynthesis
VASRERVGDARSLLDSIAICTAGELFGGVERHILGMADVFRSLGARMHLLLFEDGELAAQARLCGVTPTIVTAEGRSGWQLSRQLGLGLRRGMIRLVHVHGYKATVLCGLARRIHEFRMVKTQHGLPEPIVGMRAEALRSLVYHQLDNLVTQLSRAHVCYVTRDIRERCRLAHFGLPVSVIPNGIAPIDRHQLGPPPEYRGGCFNLAMVGRLDAVKGHLTAIEAVAGAGVPGNVHLYVIGEGPMEGALRARVRELDLDGRVHFLGFKREVLGHIAHSDALLMPSRHEGLPYVLLEAMALHVPVIGSRVGGLAEALRDQETALLVAPGSPGELSRAICRLHADRQLGGRLADAAETHWRDNYSLDVMGKRYFALYESLLGK